MLTSPFSTMLVTSIDLLVGDAPAGDHARREAERLLNLRELRTAAVHEHDANADLMQDRDLLDQPARRGEYRRTHRRSP